MKVAAALVLVLSFVLAGCGEKSSGDAKPSGSGASTAAASTAKPAGTGTGTGGW